MKYKPNKLEERLWGVKNSTMAIKVNFSLDTVGVFCAVGIGDTEMLKWNKTGVQSWEKTGVHMSAKLLMTSHLSAGSLTLIIRNFSSQYRTNHITALWGKCIKNAISQSGLHNDAVRVKEVKHPWWCCSVCSELTSDGRAYSTVSKMSSPRTAVPFMSV